MTHHRPYRPQLPADIIRADARDTRRSMNPHPGISPARETATGYCHASPNGDGRGALSGDGGRDELLDNSCGHDASSPYNGYVNGTRTTQFFILHSLFFIPHWTFTFSAKEKDSETGLSYFGSRYYSSDLSIWLSVDPMSDKYASLSPYVYCADNPVILVDPNGEEIWKPEITETGDIRLLFEEGDSYQSLTHFLGGKSGIFSKRQIDKMWKNRDEKGNVTLSKNIFSKAIKKAKELNYPSEEDIMKYKDWAAAERAGYTKNYNCIGAAISAAMGEEIGYRFIEKLDDELEYGKWYSTNTPVFGKTLLRFEYEGIATHAAIYFGQDHSGNTYVFSKNGPFPAPKIMLLQDVENIPGYGTVTPLKTGNKRLQGNSGMYNYGH